MTNNLSINKFDYIDLLRGLAILGVIAVHSYQKTPNLDIFTQWIFNYGQLGVQLFFVASALTLCLSSSQRKEKKIFNFYIRRFFRIAPLYYLGIIIYLIWGIIKNYMMKNQFTIPESHNIISIIENIFFVHGFDPRYFNSAVPGGWSIATEMAFYLIFPFLFIFQEKLKKNNFFILLVSTLLISLFLQLAIVQYFQLYLFKNTNFSIILMNDGFGYIYSSIINQINVFMIGILTFRYLNKNLESALWIFTAIILSILSIYLLNTTKIKTGYNGYIYPILSALSFSILTIKLSKISEFSSYFSNKMIVIGKVSFSMYLFHFLLLDIVNFILQQTFFLIINNNEIKLFILFLTTLYVTYYISKFSYKFIEKPGIKFGKKIIENKLPKHNIQQNS